MTAQTVIHEFEPIYDRDSRILILGTMPSPKSREAGFYYSHPQNRLWRVLADVFGEPAPSSREEKEHFLLSHHIALWDVLSSCAIKGADDSSIADPVPSDIGRILAAADIRAIFANGRKAADLYRKLCFLATGRPAVYLPSTSPANCAKPYASLLESYKVILKYCCVNVGEKG
jgi:hypoxanthine-DNA glycosylase